MKIIRTPLLLFAACASLAAQTVTPSTMPRVATISPRFQSYNVEMVEVTGGRFWKPFSPEVDALLNAPKPTGGNTLAASDYGLIDERTTTPRPDYWAALLWHRTMGTTVLDPGPSPRHPSVSTPTAWRNPREA